MATGNLPPPRLGGVGLLERAITYTLGCLQLVTPEAMSNPTPCTDWDLRALLEHLEDSVLALEEAVDTGHVDIDVSEVAADPALDPVSSLRARACRLLGAWTNAGDRDLVSVGGWPLLTGVVTSVGAIEIAVHGWDIARACGANRPIPPKLAVELLALAPLLVTEADRPARFAAPVPLPPLASAGDRLLAFLGRDPRSVVRNGGEPVSRVPLG
jgi:uncharacterized protein (TIGR03086 family)